MTDPKAIENLINQLGLVIENALATNNQTVASVQQMTAAILQQNENRIPQERTLFVIVLI